MRELSNELKLRLQHSLAWDSARLEDEIRAKKKNPKSDPDVIAAKEEHLRQVDEVRRLLQQAKKVYLD